MTFIQMIEKKVQSLIDKDIDEALERERFLNRYQANTNEGETNDAKQDRLEHARRNQRI